MVPVVCFNYCRIAVGSLATKNEDFRIRLKVLSRMMKQQYFTRSIKIQQPTMYTRQSTSESNNGLTHAY